LPVKAPALYVIDVRAHRVLAMPGSAGLGSPGDVGTVYERLEQGTEGVATYTNSADVPVVAAYRSLEDLQAVLVAERSRSDAFQPATRVLAVAGSTTVIVSVLSVAVALSMASGIADPLVALSASAQAIARGDRRTVTGTERPDEIGAVARALDSLAARVRETISGLEERVAQRTADLVRRSRYAETAAEVGRIASATLDDQRLCRTVVERLRTSLGLGYAGIYVLEPESDRARPRAESGQAFTGVTGAREESPSSGDLASRVTESIRGGGSVWENGAGSGLEASPASGTQEAILPLRSRGRTLGALVVQRPGEVELDEGFIVALRTVADQLAGALDTARLYQESQALLAAARRASGELSMASWEEVLNAGRELGFRSTEVGIERIGSQEKARAGHAQPSAASPQVRVSGGAGARLSVPIRLHGEALGTVELTKLQEAGPWLRDQVSLVEQLAVELSQALENARLYQETQRRTLREQQLRQIGSRMQSTVDLDAILRGAVEDLARALGVQSAYIQLLEGHATRDERQHGNGGVTSVTDEAQVGETGDRG
jgi:GAF domain-containing protein